MFSNNVLAGSAPITLKCEEVEIIREEYFSLGRTLWKNYFHYCVLNWSHGLFLTQFERDLIQLGSWSAWSLDLRVRISGQHYTYCSQRAVSIYEMIPDLTLLGRNIDARSSRESKQIGVESILTAICNALDAFRWPDNRFCLYFVSFLVLWNWWDHECELVRVWNNSYTKLYFQ